MSDPRHASRSPTSLAALALSMLPLAAAAQAPQHAAEVRAPAFVTNAGQWPSDLVARAAVGGGAAWFHGGGVTLQLARLADHQPAGAGSVGGPALQRVDTAVALRFVTAGTDIVPVGEGATSPDRRWLRRGAAGAPETVQAEAREALRYVAVWPGIDAVFRAVDGRVAYEFDVAPGTSAGVIELACDELSAPLTIAADGSLVMTTEIGTVRHTAPKAFELAPGGEHVAVPCAFELRDRNRYGFAVDRVDLSRALWIDPGIDWMTFFGGAGDDVLLFNEHAHGDLFALTGASLDAIPPPWNTAAPQNQDATVALVNTAAGAAGALWTVQIDGSGTDFILGMDFDMSTGLTTIVGATDSPDLPVTANAMQPAFGGVKDGFVAQLDLAGNLVYLTYLGHLLDDIVTDVHVDGGIVTVVGRTASPGLPMAGASWQATHAGGTDAFVARLDPNQPPASQLLCSTFIGNAANQGPVTDWNIYWKNFDSNQVHVAADGEVTVSIHTSTSSPWLPTSAMAYDPSPNGAADTWVGRFDPNLSTLTYGTYFGGPSYDIPLCMDVDAAGRITFGIVGQSSNLPATAGALMSTASGNNDCFFARLDPTQTGVQQLRYGTYFGGVAVDEPYGLVLEPSSAIATIVGQTRQAGFGIVATPGAFQTLPQTGSNDFSGFVLRLAMDGNALADAHYASYLSPSGDTMPVGLAQDDRGRVMITGYTFAASWPSRYTGPQPVFGGLDDGFAALMDLLPTGVARFGAASPPCAAPARMQVDSKPDAGNAGFTLLCENAPAGAIGVFVLGTPLPQPLPLLGVDVHVAPAVMVAVLADAHGFGRFDLPIRGGLVAPYGVAAQFVWVPPSPCAGPLTASSALGF